MAGKKVLIVPSLKLNFLIIFYFVLKLFSVNVQQVENNVLKIIPREKKKATMKKYNNILILDETNYS